MSALIGAVLLAAAAIVIAYHAGHHDAHQETP